MVQLADSSDINVGTDVLAIGYPASADNISDATFEPSNKEARSATSALRVGFRSTRRSAATTQGMSGGPVANLDGDIIGLISHGPAGGEAGVQLHGGLLAHLRGTVQERRQE